MSQIYYQSTRGAERNVSASYAIIKGISIDGGLFVPNQIPKLDVTINDMANMDYQEVAYHVLKGYLNDFTDEEIKGCINKAYDSKFDTDEIAPVVKKGDAYFLELFHGATIAFKDMALSILPHLMITSAKKQNINDEIVILTATSGDTGKAALEGFANVKGTKIIVFYPENGVSPIQEKQMVTQQGDNTHVVAIKGNFDDAQTGVKNIFADEEINKELKSRGYILSSANSINIGRLVPQIAYYFYAYSRLLKNGEIDNGEKINVSVPTGNFGNILAAYYAREMGLPLNKLICASNDNKVLYDFFKTGTYDRQREFKLTISPSMDILVSSNLERLLYAINEYNADETNEMMKQLSTVGQYTISEDMRNNAEMFYGNYATEVETRKAIRQVFEDTGYIMDTHTAVGYEVYKKYKSETNDQTKTVVASTASPYKFTKSVMTALDEKYREQDDFDLVHKLNEISQVPIPKAVTSLYDLEVVHNMVCGKDDMKKVVREVLN